MSTRPSRSASTALSAVPEPANKSALLFPTSAANRSAPPHAGMISSCTSIYYLDHEPAIFADYSHNPYSFTPHVDVDLAPGKPWSYELDLSKPDVYAMVVASTGTEPGTPNLHCDLAVDGAVVVSKDGPKGVLCSLRHW